MEITRSVNSVAQPNNRRLCVSSEVAYNLVNMKTIELRGKLKKVIDGMPSRRLESLADYMQFLSRPPMKRRLKAAAKAISSGKGVNWRKVRSDV
jgi:hypothetical protein